MKTKSKSNDLNRLKYKTFDKGRPLKNVKIESKRSSFGLFNRIYTSSVLTNNIKHYFACRILCLQYRAVSASILLYDGGKEKLLSKGIYLRRSGVEFIHRNNSLEQLEREHIIRYIGFYHFLFSKFVSTGIPKDVDDDIAIKIYRSFIDKKYLSFNFPDEIELIINGNFETVILDDDKSKIRFVHFCITNSRKHAADINGNLDPTKFYYKLNNELVKSESYDIGSNVDTYSGRLYYEFTIGSSIKDEEKLIIKSEFDFNKPEIPRNINNNLKRVGLRFKSKLHYVGLPLIAYGRCIGILRLFYPVVTEKEKQLSIVENSKIFYSSNAKEIIKYLKGKETQQNLLYDVEILGNLLNQTYPQNYLEGIPSDAVDFIRHSSINENVAFNLWCTNVQKAINCHGSVLRLKESALSGPSTKGCSESIRAYTLFIQDHTKHTFLIKEGKFHPFLTTIFPDVNIELLDRTGKVVSDSSKKKDKNERRIVGVVIDFGEEYNDLKVVKYYYCIGNQEEVRVARSISEIASTKFQELKLVDESNSNNSLITNEYHSLFTGKVQFYNKDEDRMESHKTRYLLVIDIPSVGVAGMATFSNSVNRRFTLSDVRFAYGQVKRLGISLSQRNSLSFEMAISNSLHSMNNVINDLIEIIKEAKKCGIPLKSIEKFERTLSRYTKKHDEFCQWVQRGDKFIEQLKEKEKEAYSIVDYITQKIKDGHFLDAEFKNIYIDILPNNCEKIITKVNKNCIWQCVEGLLDNAIYHSHDGSEMSNIGSNKYIKDFKPLTPLVNGNVVLEFSERKNGVEIKISNIGNSFTIDQAKLFGNIHFSPNDHTGNRGLGLYLIRIKLELIESRWITPEYIDQRAIFKFEIKL